MKSEQLETLCEHSMGRNSEPLKGVCVYKPLSYKELESLITGLFKERSRDTIENVHARLKQAIPGQECTPSVPGTELREIDDKLDDAFYAGVSDRDPAMVPQIAQILRIEHP